MPPMNLRLAAEIMEEVARAAEPAEASSLVLATVLSRSSFPRGALAIRRRDGNWRIRRGFIEEEELPLPLDGGSAELERALRAPEATLLTDAADTAPVAIHPCAVLPFRDPAGSPLGALLLEARALDEETARVAEAVRRCAPVLWRVLEWQRLQSRWERTKRENTLLRRIQDELVDPVILTDMRNDILVANRRAMELFVAQPGDNVGRARAIQTNTFLFSLFLTQKQIADSGTRGRELNLVDPSDGSDLLFEVLTAALPSSDGQDRHVISVLRDITDLKRAVGELELEYKRARAAEHRALRESQRLNAIIENAAEPILVTDAESKIVLMNAEAEGLFDLPAELTEGDLRRRLWANATHLTSLVNEFLLRPETRRKEKLALSEPSTGRQMPVEAVNTKILDKLGEPLAVVTVLRDLTQEKENERLALELRSLNERLEERIELATEELAERNRLLVWQSQELEKASRLKSEFLARMSHELRTPINAMVGFTSLLRERIYGELTREQETALDKIRSASDHLLSLISEILDLSKIEAGKMPLRLAEVRLDEIIAEISQTLRPLIDAKELTFRVRLADDLPLLNTDPTKLRQVLLNLLENAVKYTPAGWVELRATATREGERVCIEVEDTGIGIEEMDLKLIFDDFRQADESAARQYGGTGLGLSISRKLLALMGGGISVSSTVGEGSTFTVELPANLEPGSVSAQMRRALLANVDPAPPHAGDRNSERPERLEEIEVTGEDRTGDRSSESRGS